MSNPSNFERIRAAQQAADATKNMAGIGPEQLKAIQHLAKYRQEAEVAKASAGALAAEATTREARNASRDPLVQVALASLKAQEALRNWESLFGSRLVPALPTGHLSEPFKNTSSSVNAQFESELAGLRKKVSEQSAELTRLEEMKATADEQQEVLKERERTIAELQTKEQLGFLLNRVCDSARVELISGGKLCDQFLSTRECDALVLAVDIRRSTELMLKAKSAEAFAEFLTELCAGLVTVIKDSFGVFDKFTGDGVLAFFPDFYAGPDSPYFALAVADKCHKIFREHYARCRNLFNAVLTDVGLGIGLDYGRVHLVQFGGGLTVVGVPVVYACRFSNCPSGVTLANQPAFNLIAEKYSFACRVKETTIDSKHDGRMLAYEVGLVDHEFEPKIPDWVLDSATAGGTETANPSNPE